MASGGIKINPFWPVGSAVTAIMAGIFRVRADATDTLSAPDVITCRVVLITGIYLICVYPASWYILPNARNQVI